jgi:hypothetical protein
MAAQQQAGDPPQPLVWPQQTAFYQPPQRVPYKCPICEGHGLVRGGFYESSIEGSSRNRISNEKCRACDGSGIIFSS